MAMRKLSITLPEELAEMVKRQAEEEGTSVSAVIADFLAALARQRAGEEAVQWFEEEEGPFTPEELIEAERIWQAAEAHQRKMKRAAS
ncbi:MULTISPECIES: DUF6364 family protein [Actinoallomurus]|uniref:Ribbon-helix-helix protein CopG domain-containing protein n=1 Tax=Actinoallomurus spadix TaxID=79912 RepID=A0ABP3FH29_9ACTN|nr:MULTISPECIES: DUF6364 family protein [Actinoallomurus]MCO5974720.1 DUF6364 family protein [Actinoallomurus soli]MCO5990741.1 DUF6364 family protein [Actinoallomurus spadix]MCO5993879.1 DUF6364 family protein [Actinoallomurus rhizosphaericola]